MSVLDELRAALKDTFTSPDMGGLTTGGDSDPYWYAADVLAVLYGFDAANPGLENHTIHCKTAGCPLVTHWGGHGWKTGRGRWNVQWWLCPACAKAGKVTP